MGVAELRSAFNEVSEPAFTCSRALLAYEKSGDVQWQRLTFSGIGQDGEPFEIKSDQLRPDADVVVAARATAQALVNRATPPPAPPPDSPTGPMS